MTNRTIAIVFILSALVVIPLNAFLYSTAYASGGGELTVVGLANPLTWDWIEIGTWAVTILSALIVALRPIAALTTWKGDNWLLGKMEAALRFILSIFTPRGAGFADKSLGGGKSGTGQDMSGGKSGGGAS